MKYKVEVMTKGSSQIQIAKIDMDELQIDDIDYEVFNNIIDESDYLVTGGIGEGFDGTFEVTVSDEEGNVVYENEEFSDFSFVINVEDIDDLTEQAKQNIEKRFEQDEACCKECGMYAVRADELKWYGFTFTVEDSEFHPDKLIFVEDKKLQGLVYDYMTGPDYVMYGDEFCEVECDEDYDDYGFNDSIMKMNEYGYFEHVKDIE